VDQYPTNSIFETTLDISNVQEGGIAQFTIHRNSYQSVNTADKEKFAISLIYDRDLSDMQIGENVGVLNPDRDVVLFMELHGQAGMIRS
jgi:hypothetical protein